MPGTSPVDRPEPAGALLSTDSLQRAVVGDRFDIPRRDDDADEAPDEEGLGAMPIEPGDPAPENVIFVLLGVLIALAVVARLVQLFG